MHSDIICLLSKVGRGIPPHLLLEKKEPGIVSYTIICYNLIYVVFHPELILFRKISTTL